MNALCCIALAALSIWDYPSRQPMHEKLRGQFIAALRTGDTETMTEVCRKGVELLPDGTILCTTYIKLFPDERFQSVACTRFRISETDKLAQHP